MSPGNYSCVPSYSTPDWVLVRVMPRPHEDDLHHQEAGVIIEKQPASLRELGVQKQQDNLQGENLDLGWI